MESFEKADLENILRQAKKLINKTISDLLGTRVLSEKDKGAIGQTIQHLGFGIEVNNNANPDFNEIGVELKAIPLTLRKNGDLTIKERTKICSIDYDKLLHESWTNSSARKKLNKILFIFYEFNKEYPYKSKILRYYLFDLSKYQLEEQYFQKDWALAQEMVRKGLAHELSESQFNYLATTTSGSGGQKSIVSQPITVFSPVAKKRSFSLKPSFTKVLWQELKGKKFDSMNDLPDKNTDVVSALVFSLEKHIGKSLQQISIDEGIQLSVSKDFASKLIRVSLGFKGNNPIKEIEQLAITIKFVPARHTFMNPYEAISFSHQPFGDILEENNFFESELYDKIKLMMLIPILSRERTKDPSKKIIGKSVIFRPDPTILEEIELEWEKYRSIIRSGLEITTIGNRRVTNLPKESETKYIHMRPHAKDGKDYDKSISHLSVVKHSFWLNKKFVHSLLLNTKYNG